MKRNVAALILVAVIGHSGQVWALDPQSVQAYCDDIKKAAQDAQTRYIQAYQPRTDPGKTFDDATSSCLDFITNFQIGIPSLWDGILQKVAQQILQRACQAARSQFDKAVNDATQSVNGVVGQVPGVSVGVGTQSGGGSGLGINTTVTNDGGATAGNAATSTVDRLFNVLR